MRQHSQLVDAHLVFLSVHDRLIHLQRPADSSWLSEKPLAQFHHLRGHRLDRRRCQCDDDADREALACL